MNALREFWLPDACALCGVPPSALCATCSESFPLRGHAVERPRAISISGFAACDFNGVVTDLVHAFKRGGSHELARFMAEPIAEQLAAHAMGVTGEAGVTLLAVPSRADSFRRRGFVPARLLAQAVCARLSRRGVRARTFNGARLNRTVQDQALLNLQQRAANIAGAISVDPPPRSAGPRPKLVLLDDVVTTGATIGELHRAATQAGWQTNFFVSFAETL